jgi:hypothetical protein
VIAKVREILWRAYATIVILGLVGVDGETTLES